MGICERRWKVHEFGEDLEEPFGLWEGQCQVCDMWGRVDDLMLCEDCTAKLECDLIRQRELRADPNLQVYW